MTKNRKICKPLYEISNKKINKILSKLDIENQGKHLSPSDVKKGINMVINSNIDTFNKLINENMIK